MASPETALFAILTGGSPNAVADIIGARAYPDKLPQGVAYPAIRVQRISTFRGAYRMLATGRSVFARLRFQIDCWALTRLGALALADVVRDTLDGYRGTAGGFRIGSVAVDDEAGDVEPNIGPNGADVYRQRVDVFVAHLQS